jgi:cardiolipin synthase (CMP-forming)
VLGSYLDPLADKVLVGCVVAALAAQGALPAWVAAVVLGRDAALVLGMAGHRMRALGWRLSGVSAAQFFSTRGVGRARREGGGGGEGSATTHAGELPLMRPLMISKVNTVLQLALVSCCMTHAWQGIPGEDTLQYLELLTAGTTAASLAGYAWLYASGGLLPVRSRIVQ